MSVIPTFGNVTDPDPCTRSSQMALSAASPFYRGYVSDIDCRWGVISASVDDRTQEERGLKVRRSELENTMWKSRQ